MPLVMRAHNARHAVLSARSIGEEKMCVTYGAWGSRSSEKAMHWLRPLVEMSGSRIVRSSTGPVLCADW
jgi:hypothetical protein